MEDEWVAYLRDTRPDLYDQMRRSTMWAVQRRDEQIARLTSELDQLAKHHAIVEHEVVRLRKEVAGAH